MRIMVWSSAFCSSDLKDQFCSIRSPSDHRRSVELAGRGRTRKAVGPNQGDEPIIRRIDRRIFSLDPRLTTTWSERARELFLTSAKGATLFFGGDTLGGGFNVHDYVSRRRGWYLRSSPADGECSLIKPPSAQTFEVNPSFFIWNIWSCRINDRFAVV